MLLCHDPCDLIALHIWANLKHSSAEASAFFLLPSVCESLCSHRNKKCLMSDYEMLCWKLFSQYSNCVPQMRFAGMTEETCFSSHPLSANTLYWLTISSRLFLIFSQPLDHVTSHFKALLCLRAVCLGAGICCLCLKGNFHIRLCFFCLLKFIVFVI